MPWAAHDLWLSCVPMCACVHRRARAGTLVYASMSTCLSMYHPGSVKGRGAHVLAHCSVAGQVISYSHGLCCCGVLFTSTEGVCCPCVTQSRRQERKGGQLAAWLAGANVCGCFGAAAFVAITELESSELQKMCVLPMYASEGSLAGRHGGQLVGWRGQLCVAAGMATCVAITSLS